MAINFDFTSHEALLPLFLVGRQYDLTRDPDTASSCKHRSLRCFHRSFGKGKAIEIFPTAGFLVSVILTVRGYVRAFSDSK